MSKKPKSLEDIPVTLTLLPLSGALLLPQTQRPLAIFEQRYLDLIDYIISNNRLVGLIQPQDSRQESPRGNNVSLQKIGCIGYLRAFEEQEDNQYAIVLEGISRFALIEEISSDTPFRTAKIDVSTYASDFHPQTGEDQVNRQEFLQSMRDYAKFADLDFDWASIDKIHTSMLVNICCVLSPYGATEKQAFLEATTLNQRAQTLIALSEMEIAAGSTSTGTSLQ